MTCEGTLCLPSPTTLLLVSSGTTTVLLFSSSLAALLAYSPGLAVTLMGLPGLVTMLSLAMTLPLVTILPSVGVIDMVSLICKEIHRYYVSFLLVEM